MAISTNPKPTIYRNLYQNTTSVFSVRVIMSRRTEYSTVFLYTKNVSQVVNLSRAYTRIITALPCLLLNG